MCLEQVYLFISASKKVVGCLVAERINSAYRIVPHGQKGSKSVDTQCITPRVSDFGRGSGELSALSGVELRQEKTKPCKQLLWGGWKFTREVVNRKKTQNENPQELARSIMCSKTGVPAVCGVRGIWVSRSERRKGVASHLLDSMRLVLASSRPVLQLCVRC
jgi:N-acetyltransferase